MERRLHSLNDNIPYGYCQCGCGKKTNLATKTDGSTNKIKGRPMRFVRGHNQNVNGPADTPFKRGQEYRLAWERAHPDIPYGYCWCGCGQKTHLASHTCRTKNWVKDEPLKYILHHYRRLNSPEYQEEDRGYKTPCWIWQRSIGPNGYGLAAKKRGTRVAHRIYYEDAYGLTRSDLDHLCRVRSCVNPDHLEPVTPLENSHRGAKTRLSQRQVNEIRQLYATGKFSARKLGPLFGISGSHVWAIVARKRWPD